MNIKQSYDLVAYKMRNVMDIKKKRRMKATEKLLNLDWEKVSLEEVKNLLTQGANVNATDKYGWSPLLRATDFGRMKIMELLIAHGADVVKDKGVTPLYFASSKGHIEMVKLLLAHGANVKVEDKDGNTPLHEACQFGHAEVAKLLLAYGADVRAKNEYGKTPLHKASRSGYIGVAKVLLAHGADIKATDGAETAADTASFFGYTEMVTFLREVEELSAKRTAKAKEIRAVDADRSGQPVNHSVRRMLFGGENLRQNAPLSLVVAERLKERQSRS